MSDPEHDPDVTPEQEARLRHLLARARHDEGVPDDVAARLDRVLEQLRHEPGTDEPGTDGASAARPDDSVIALAGRRRRRVGALLVAAAVVVAGLVGVGQLIDPVGTGEADSAAGSSASQAEQAEQNAAPERGTGDPTASSERDDGAAAGGTQDVAPQPETSAPSDEPDVRASAPLVRVTSRGFNRVAERLQGRAGVVSRAGTALQSARLSTAPAFVCPTTTWGAGRLIAVLYDGVPSVLAYREPTGDSQVVDLLQCGSGDVVRSTTLGRR